MSEELAKKCSEFLISMIIDAEKFKDFTVAGYCKANC